MEMPKATRRSSSPRTSSRVQPDLQKAKAAEKAKENKAALGPKTVNGVKIDDKKLGNGQVCKKGDRVGMRYIGKLTDGKVFDCKSCDHPFDRIIILT